MSKLKDKINDALGIDIDKLIDDDDDTPVDKKEIEKYNNRKEIICQLRQDLKDARSLEDKHWSQLLLKQSAEKIAIVQEVFKQEIEDQPCSKNITSFSELANSLVNTVNGVMDIQREEERLHIARDKNRIRQMENEGKRGPLIEAEGNVVGIGSNNDIMKLIEKGITPSALIKEDEEVRPDDDTKEIKIIEKDDAPTKTKKERETK